MTASRPKTSGLQSHTTETAIVDKPANAEEHDHHHGHAH
jgi:hypothetical protein